MASASSLVPDEALLPQMTDFRLQIALAACYAAGDGYSGTATIEYAVEHSDEDMGSSGLLFHADHAAVELLGLRVTSGKKVAKLKRTSRYRGGRSATFGSSLTPDPLGDVVYVETAEALSAGQWSLEVKFKGSVRGDNVGVYACVPGSKKCGAVLATHFEVTEARRAFPCVDDIYCRAPFTLSLVVPANVSYVASNAPESSRTSSADGVAITFETTRSIPAYVYGFVVASIPAVKVLSRNVRRYSAADASDTITFEVVAIGDKPVHSFDLDSTLKFAVESYTHQLTHLARCRALETGDVESAEQWFALPHSTIRIVALPVMKISGMENDGLIFLHASLGELQSKAAGKPRQQATEALARFVAHEIAHHWIGNAVGLPFGTKEGVCLLLESWCAGLLLGRALVGGASDAKGAKAADDVAATAAHTKSHEAAVGKELTDLTYQNSEAAMRRLAVTVGWDRFLGGLARLVEDCSGTFVSDAQFREVFTSM
jgi:hypothetical protein